MVFFFFIIIIIFCLLSLSLLHKGSTVLIIFTTYEVGDCGAQHFLRDSMCAK